MVVGLAGTTVSKFWQHEVDRPVPGHRGDLGAFGFLPVVAGRIAAVGAAVPVLRGLLGPGARRLASGPSRPPPDAPH
ncbi:hypothetical protein Acsp04_60400 [Actinomadura sp. NBRC 104425]|uniref:hypothetical protein n=1 Tax=Actinomadura sp. NBRC 104425 TaxID=3032204 RepID=UPI0024A02B0D|nr:hypothetical protein [Actinomadura sp. NBRC 104425]GLZ15805.1 hypothetical protein Acsp04_60400 [Actinomadura sp. NBRC 104425]